MRKLAYGLAIVSSLAYADNFVLTNDEANKDLFDMNGHASHTKEQKQPSQKIIIDGVNPDSDLGKAISKMLNPPKKPVAKKKKVVKKPAPKKDENASKDEYGKIIDEHNNGVASLSAKEVPAPSDAGQQAASHNDKATPPPPPAAPAAKDSHGAPAKDAHTPAPASGH